MNRTNYEIEKAYAYLKRRILDYEANPSQWFVGVTPDINYSFARLRMARNKYCFIELSKEEFAMAVSELLLVNLETSKSSVQYSGKSTWVYAYLLGEGDENYEQQEYEWVRKKPKRILPKCNTPISEVDGTKYR